MKIALAALFAATVATTTGSAFAQDLAPQPAELVPAGVPLRVELDKSYPMQVGTRIEGHLTEPVYLIDHVAVPADSKVYGTITGKHSVSRQVRTAAMFNGDLTPLKNADVTFSELETPDGRHFNIDTDATERTAKVVRMAAPDQAPRRSLGQKHRRSLPLDQAGNRCRIQLAAQVGHCKASSLRSDPRASPGALGRNAI